MKQEQLSDALNLLDDDILEETGALRRGKGRKSRRMKWLSLATCLVIAAAAVSQFINYSGEPPVESPSAGDTGPSDILPGGIRPEILVDGTLFYWSGMAQEMCGAEEPYGQVYTVGTADTYLPESYTEYGWISSVSESEPAEDCQMKAGFEAEGIIYTSQTTPETVYILMTTDWFENYYIRFISAKLDAGWRVMWNGTNYRIRIGEDPSETLKELPEGCREVGQLHYIGRDAIPQQDLETNCPCDTYSYALEGRQVFYDPGNPQYLYVYERHYWSGGEYDSYLKCPLWGD